METNLVVLETPELQKTIEEINDEIEPKIFSGNVGIENRPRELSLAEIFEIFNAEKQKPAMMNYAREQKVCQINENRIKAIEKELIAIEKEMKKLEKTDPSYEELVKEYKELQEKVERIKDKSQAVSKKHSLPRNKPTVLKGLSEPFKGDIAFDLTLTEVEERNRLSKLENKIREIEFALGGWKQAKSMAEVLSEFLSKTKFLNLELLERTKDQAKHLGTDLDIILSTESGPITSDNSKQLGDLHRDTFCSLSNIMKLSLYLERLSSSAGLFNIHSDIAKSLLNLEVSSENVLGRLSHSAIALENLKEGFEENAGLIKMSLAKINKLAK